MKADRTGSCGALGRIGAGVRGAKKDAAEVVANNEKAQRERKMAGGPHAAPLLKSENDGVKG